MRLTPGFASSARAQSAAFCRLLGLACLLAVVPLRAQPNVTIAVAANFQPTMGRLAAAFAAESAFEAVLVAGSTGQLYAQITRGAPFDVFLSADTERPDLLRAGGLVVDQRTYAVGRLVLWSADATHVRGRALEDVLAQPFRHLAIASPELAPYGRAAQQALESLGVWHELQPRIVYGQTVGQALAMAASRNAEMALVARSLVTGAAAGGAFLSVPDSLHEPIRQDAALLDRAKDNPAARAFFEFLQSATARAIIEADGYRLP